jgi:hypothetical protein
MHVVVFSFLVSADVAVGAADGTAASLTVVVVVLLVICLVGFYTGSGARSFGLRQAKIVVCAQLREQIF